MQESNLGICLISSLMILLMAFQHKNGFVLNPLIFLLYIQTISHTLHTTIMFADETTVLVKGIDIQSVYIDNNMNAAIHV